MARYRDSDDVLKAALLGCNVPVQRLFYSESSEKHITYGHIYSDPLYFTNDSPREERHTYEVIIHARTGHVDLLRTVCAALRSSGFENIRVQAESYVQDTGMFRVPIQCSYTEYITEEL